MKDKVLIRGPEEQGQFLHRMGIKTRLNMLLEKCTEKDSKHLESSYHMIVDKDQMGSKYKCFAAFPLVLEEYLKPYPVAGFL